MTQNDFIAIASPNQFEIKVPYRSEGTLRKVAYHTKLYFFIPKTLNITPLAYTNDHFYNDYISYIRFITPQKTLGNIAWRLRALIASLAKTEHDPRSKDTFTREMKLIVSSYVSYLERYSRECAHRPIRLHRLHTVLRRIEQIHALVDTLIPAAERTRDNDLIDCAISTAEYLSYATQNSLLEINVQLRDHEETYRETITCIVRIVNAIIAFCKSHDLPIISSDTYQNEKVIYRSTILKKHFYGVLYLYQKKKRDGGGIKEIYYALAAGISMVFTTLIVFFSQKEYGNFTLSFFAALVISYMFKDRIKEAYRGYFDKKMAIKTYDYREKITSADKKVLFAAIKERMRFVQRKNLPDAVRKLRLLKVPRRLSTYLEEDIIQFEKKVTLYNRNIQNKYKHSIDGIHNIMRFDISQYLKRMDTSKVPLYRVNEHKLFGKRIYHINIVIENRTEHGSELYRARIVVSKRGIKRIELPESDIRIFPKPEIVHSDSWFGLKKSGLLRKKPAALKKETDGGSTPRSEA